MTKRFQRRHTIAIPPDPPMPELERLARRVRSCQYHSEAAAVAYAMAAHESMRRTAGWAARWAYFMDIQRVSGGISRDHRRKIAKFKAQFL